jgi:hypothetical protein
VRRMNNSMRVPSWCKGAGLSAATSRFVKAEGAAVAAPVWQGGVPLRLNSMGPVNMDQNKEKEVRQVLRVLDLGVWFPLCHGGLAAA